MQADGFMNNRHTKYIIVNNVLYIIKLSLSVQKSIFLNGIKEEVIWNDILFLKEEMYTLKEEFLFEGNYMLTISITDNVITVISAVKPENVFLF